MAHRKSPRKSYRKSPRKSYRKSPKAKLSLFQRSIKKHCRGSKYKGPHIITNPATGRPKRVTSKDVKKVCK